MASIYTYDKVSGLFNGSVDGSYESLIINIPDDCDFTLTRPPDIYEPYKWNGKEWEVVDADNQSS